MAEKLDRYELSEVLDSGVFATVWRAHDPMLGMDVAIKLLADDAANDPDMRERFLAEARRALQNTSPDGVRVHHVAESADLNIPYIVLALADAMLLDADSHAPTTPLADAEPEPEVAADTSTEPDVFETEPGAGEPGFLGESTLPSPRKMLSILIAAMLIPAAIIGVLVVSNLGNGEPEATSATTTVAPETDSAVEAAAPSSTQRIPDDFPVPEGAVLNSGASVEGLVQVFTITGSPDRLVVMYSSFEGWRVVSSSQTGSSVSLIVSNGTDNVLVIGDPVADTGGAEVIQLTITPAGVLEG